MSTNYSDQPPVIDAATVTPRRKKYSWWMLIVLPAWVLASFLSAQLLLVGLVKALTAINVPLAGINQTVLTTGLAALIYIITLALVIGLPWVIKRFRVSRLELGLQRLPSWTDIWMAPVGLVVYFVASALLILLASQLFPWFDVNQAQDTGFDQLNFRYEYILAFMTLVIIAPIAEEVLFRGYLFGKLRQFVPIWAAILATSILFGFVHGAWNVAIDTFALSVVMCLLRLATGSLWAPILLHMAKNGIAFYILFINPALLSTLGG